MAFLGTAEAQDIVASYGVVFPAIASSTKKAVEVFERTGLPTAPFTDHVDRGTTFYFPLTYFDADVAAIMKPATIGCNMAMGQVITRRKKKFKMT